MTTTTENEMTTTMTPGVLPDTWDVRCIEHGLDRRGLAQAHAQNLVRKHEREDHPAAYHVGAVAALVRTAAENVHLGRQEAGDPDKAWVLRKTERDMEDVLSVWMTLLGLPLSMREAALEAAYAMDADTVAHVAPF